MTGERVDTRPLRTAAARQAPLVATGSLLSGPGYLTALTLAGLPVGRLDILIAVALSALSSGPVLLALRRIVRTGEARCTPVAAPRDNAGQRLRARDGDALEQALDELADRRAADPPAPPPAGTRSYPAVGTARSMRADDAPAWAAGEDWTGERVRSYDEDRARARVAQPDVARGRDVADRADRRRAAHAIDPTRR